MDSQDYSMDVPVPLGLADIRRQRGWFLALGVFLMIVGFVAILFPFTASLAVTVSIGAVLTIAGIAQLVHAFGVRRWRGFLVTLLSALLSLAVGTLLLFYPVPGVLSLTLLVGVFLLAGGALKILLSLRLRPLAGWSWLLFAGVLAVLLGVLILWLWPSAAAWVPGVLVGADLVFSGWWMFLLALALRRDEPAGAAGGTVRR
jgi:uncharacterized membrane protein HdeD (DUF308 family)